MQATPTLWQSLLSESGDALPDLTGLTMLTGGEALSGELARALRGRGREARQSLRPDRDDDLVGRDALEA